jgi:hypothetical protein
MNSSLAHWASCYAATTCYHSPFQNQSHHCMASSNGTCYLIALYIPTCFASILFNVSSSSVKNYALIEDLLIQSRNHKTITRFTMIGEFVVKTFRLKSQFWMVPGNKMVQIFINYSASSQPSKRPISNWFLSLSVFPRSLLSLHISRIVISNIGTHNKCWVLADLAKRN